MFVLFSGAVLLLACLVILATAEITDLIQVVPYYYPPSYINDTNDFEARQNEWYGLNSLDLILNEPQPFFYVYKKYFPIYYQNLGKNGEQLAFLPVGAVNYERLEDYHITPNLLMRHVLFLFQYQKERVIPNDQAGQRKLLLFIDFNDFTFDRSSESDLVNFLQLVDEMYPYILPFGYSMKVYFLNASGFFKAPIIRTIVSLLGNMKKDITIVPDDELQVVLSQYMDANNLPTQYGGKAVLGTSEIEQQLISYVDSLNKRISAYTISSSVLAPFSSIPEKELQEVFGKVIPNIVYANSA